MTLSTGSGSSSSSSIWRKMLRRKPLEPPAESQLVRSLTVIDLILYGVGSSVGAGIYCLVGIGANMAGPGISASFFLCGVACIFTSLAYAEFAARIPVTGSAYVYAYTTFGEVWGWLVGWNLTLGYGFAASVVARSWGEYVANLLRSILQSWGLTVLESKLYLLTKFPVFGSYTCSPLSTVIVVFSTWILKNGAKESSKFNNVMTCFNIAVLLIVIFSGIPVMEVDNLTPFFPAGASGVARGSGLVFFAFIGFDMVAALAEECVDPGRTMPIGIVGSLVISAIIYIVVSLSVIGAAPIHLLGGDVPITNALLANACCSHEQQLSSTAMTQCLNSSCPALHPYYAFASRVVGGGAIFALTSACFVGLMGQPRIFFAMAKDGLLFPIFGKVNPETHVPTAGIVITGIIGAVLACFVDLEVLANVISLGTLLVFTFVDAAVIILRLRPWHEQINLSERQYVLRTPQLNRGAQRHGRGGLRDHWWEWSRTVQDNGSKPTLLISTFSISMLLLSFGIRDAWPWSLVFLFGMIAIMTALRLLVLPKSDPPESFTCPLVPLVPLLGMTFNIFMAGSLPSASWMLSSLWMVCGFLLYMFYGIQHSTLGNMKNDAEGKPLIHTIPSSAHYNAIPSAATLVMIPPPAARSSGARKS